MDRFTLPLPETVKTFSLILLAALSLCLCSFAAPADVTALLERGDGLSEQLKTSEALAVYLEAQKLTTKDDAEVLYRLSRATAELMVDTEVKAEQKELGMKALGYAQRAVAAAPRNASAHLSVAICYGRVSQFLDNRTKIDNSKLIKQHAETAIALNPASDYAYHVLGAWNYELAGLGGFSRAIAKMVYGTIPTASYEDAETYFKKAIAINPQRVAHHIELGRTYAALKQTELARASLAKGLALPSREKDDPQTKARGREALKKL